MEALIKRQERELDGWVITHNLVQVGKVILFRHLHITTNIIFEEIFHGHPVRFTVIVPSPNCLLGKYAY